MFLTQVHECKRVLACRFFIFVLLLFLVHSMGIALFRFLGSLCRNEVIASTGGSFFFLVLLLVGGFLLAKQNIPDWWIWAYWSVCLTSCCLLPTCNWVCIAINMEHMEHIGDNET